MDLGLVYKPNITRQYGWCCPMIHVMHDPKYSYVVYWDLVNLTKPNGDQQRPSLVLQPIQMGRHVDDSIFRVLLEFRRFNRGLYRARKMFQLGYCVYLKYVQSYQLLY